MDKEGMEAQEPFALGDNDMSILHVCRQKWVAWLLMLLMTKN